MLPIQDTTAFSCTGANVNIEQSAAGSDRVAAAVAALARVDAGPASLCALNATTLCIDNQPGDGRFQVRATFQTTQGAGSSGGVHALPLAAVPLRARALSPALSPPRALGSGGARSLRLARRPHPPG